MPYDREHGVITWGGSLPGGEQWSSTIRVAETKEVLGANDTADWPEQMEEWLDHYTSVLQAHHAQSNSMIHQACKLEFVKFNRVDINGRYVDPTTHLRQFAAISGPRGSNLHPNQVAMVVTWTTEVSRGPASKGRLYVPLPALAIGTDGRISVSDATDAALAYKNLVESLSDIPFIDTSSSPDTVVMSKAGTGTKTRRISGVRVGRVLDTQRRRRANMIEDYQVTGVDLGVF